MEIEEFRDGNRLVLKVCGRIDTNTSAQFQEKVLNSLRKSPEITLDMAEVDYVSSAGLRGLLIGEQTAKSKQGEMKLICVHEEVMNVFRMTGFDKVLCIG